MSTAPLPWAANPPRNTPADKLRGDAIHATMQAQRTHRATTCPLDGHAFDEAHAIIERLTADGYLDLDPRRVAMRRHPAGKGKAAA